MVTSQQPNLTSVDWSLIPAPPDDGAAGHLVGSRMPDVTLSSTDGDQVNLGAIKGRWVLFAYPRTGVPGQISIVDGWDMIPGARGCTPQSCSFRDLARDLEAAGASRVFGISTQDTDYQRELAERLHLPFPILSDEGLKLASALSLPLMEVGGLTLLRRLSMIVDDGRIAAVQYPVFPPDQNAATVLSWLRANPR